MFFDKFKFDKEFLLDVLKIAVPLMLQQLIVSSVNLVDNLMVGFLGDSAMGGVSAVNKFYMIANFATFGMSAAASVFMAQYFGAKNNERLKESFRFMLVSTMILNLAFLITGKLFPENVLKYFTNNEDVIRVGLEYFSIAVYTFVPISIIISVNNAIRSIGDSKILLVTSGVSVIINVVLNYCLIFGNFGFPVLGVKGAAIATLVARSVEVCLCLFILWAKKYDFNTSIFEIFKIDLSLVKAILIKAIPLCTNEVLWSFGMATMFKFYATRGLMVMSGYAVSSTISDIFFTLFGGMSMATTVFVSQRLGANKIDEAKVVAYKLLGVSFVLSLFFACGLFMASFIVPYLYKNVSIEARQVAINVLRVQSIMFWIYMFTAECYFILRSGGDSKNTLIMDSGFMWLLNIPILFVATYYTNFGYLAIYLIGQSTDIIKLIFSYHLLRKEKWANNLTV